MKLITSAVIEWIRNLFSSRKRQLEILEKQTEILQKQTEILSLYFKAFEIPADLPPNRVRIMDPEYVPPPPPEEAVFSYDPILSYVENGR